MKSIISLSAITMMAAVAMVGCAKNSSSNSTDVPVTNSSMSDASSPVTNRLPDMNTNMPASTNK